MINLPILFTRMMQINMIETVFISLSMFDCMLDVLTKYYFEFDWNTVENIGGENKT